MHDRPARIYRATAYYEDYEYTRDFLTKRRRDSWAKARTEGYPADPSGLLDDGRPEIPPALRVEVQTSKNVEWL